jgi:type I restriction enzyme, S subunit
VKKGWRRKTLGELCDVVNGGTPKTGVSKYWSGENLWVTPAEMGKRATPYIDNTERKLSDLGLRYSSARMCPPYSIILSTRAPIGYLVINTEPMSTNQGCKTLVPGSQIHYKYLYYFLSGNVDLLNSLGTGATFKELSGGKLKEVMIPLAPLPDQQRIVGILDEAIDGIETAKDNAKKNLANARAIFDSHLLSIFSHGDIGWAKKKLGDVCIVERGSSPRPIKKYFTTAADGVNWIKIGDTEEGGKYVYSTAQKITPEGAKKSRFVKENDFILTNSMSFGRPYIMKINGYIHDGWFVLRLNQSLNLDYFYYLLASDYVRSQFNRLASGAIVLNISSELVKQAVLPIPPLGEQEILVEKLSELSGETQRLESIYKQKLNALEALKKSLLHQAFSGQL